MERQGNRIMAVRDGRNPYGSRGGYVVSRRSRRGRRGDRGMDYAEHDMRGSGSQYSMRRYRDMGDYNQDMRGGDYGSYDMGDMAREYDREGQDYGDMRNDGHHGRQGGYEPVEFMGYCSGYYGSPDQDYGYDMRGRGGRDYGYDMRGRGSRMDYGYGRDYGDYDDYGDYGETLSDQELEHWNKKLLGQLDEREKQMFSKDAIMQKIKSMGIEMKNFTDKELYTLAIAKYIDHKQSIGQNSDLAIKLAKDAMNDQDAKYKGSEWLAVYYDTFVED